MTVTVTVTCDCACGLQGAAVLSVELGNLQRADELLGRLEKVRGVHRGRGRGVLSPGEWGARAQKSTNKKQHPAPCLCLHQVAPGEPEVLHLRRPFFTREEERYLTGSRSDSLSLCLCLWYAPGGPRGARSSAPAREVLSLNNYAESTAVYKKALQQDSPDGASIELLQGLTESLMRTTSPRRYYCALCTVHCSLFTVHCSMFTVHCSLFTVHCSLWVRQRGPPLSSCKGLPSPSLRTTSPRRYVHYCTTVLLYYCATVLLYYCATVLLYYCATVLLCYCATVLLCYCATVLLCYCATVLLCYCATVLLCYCATVLLCYCATVLLCYCATVLLYYCATVLLCYCATRTDCTTVHCALCTVHSALFTVEPTSGASIELL